MKKELHSLNFNNLIIINDYSTGYNFHDYMKNDGHIIKGYCTSCEEKGFNKSPIDSKYKLTNISHGSHTDDFFEATHSEKIDTTNWIKESIMFIFESPSNNYDKHIPLKYKGFNKFPSEYWYWVDEYKESYHYPNFFTGRQYSNLLNSIIFSFKLRNCYITNLIKCSLNNKKGEYKGIAYFDENCIYNCANRYLLNEISIVDPKLIFTFGSNVYEWVEELTEKKGIIVESLPHPAGQRRGFKDKYFRHLYYNIIIEGLYRSKIISMDIALKYYRTFLKLAPED